MSDVDGVRTAAKALMPEILEQLERLVAIPSVAFPGYPPEPVHEMAATALELFQAAGISNAALQDVPDGYPPIYGVLEGPPGSPVVVLYAHYDVQPAPPEQGWTSDPWTPTRKDDGRIYGRGAADDKGGLAIHLGTLRHFAGSPPCTIKLIVEGMEETSSNLEPFVEAHPDLFACDLFVVCDMGNLVVNEPTLTTTLRGDVACVVTVRTLEHPLHSGVFGGPVPDAMMALARFSRRSMTMTATSPSTVCARSNGKAWTSTRTTFARAPTCWTASGRRAAARSGRDSGRIPRSRRSGSIRPRSTAPPTCSCRRPGRSSRCASCRAPSRPPSW